MNSLLASLAGCDFESEIVGPRGDTSHHVQSIDILQGNDDHEATSRLHVTANSLNVTNEKIKTPNRIRSMGGIIITFWSEEYYTWSKQFLFHKGQIYESDTLLEENIDIHEPEQEDKQLEFYFNNSN